MTEVILLTGRNLKLFFRDRAAVFFSLLAALMLVLLYLLFLGKLQVDSLSKQLPQATESDIQVFVTAWVFSGIIMVTTLTCAIAALGIFVADRESGRFTEFLVSPISRAKIIFGYLLASFVVSFTMSVIVLVLGQIFLLSQGNPVITLINAGKTLLVMALSSIAFAALASFVVSFLRSSSSFAALSTVVGTTIGFFAGAYIPPGTLPVSIVNILNTLPFAHSAMLIRRPLTAEPLLQLTGSETSLNRIPLEEFYGISIRVGEFTVQPWLAVIALLGVFALATFLGVWQLSRRIR